MRCLGGRGGVRGVRGMPVVFVYVCVVCGRGYLSRELPSRHSHACWPVGDGIQALIIFDDASL